MAATTRVVGVESTMAGKKKRGGRRSSSEQNEEEPGSENTAIKLTVVVALIVLGVAIGFAVRPLHVCARS